MNLKRMLAAPLRTVIRPLGVDIVTYPLPLPPPPPPPPKYERRPERIDFSETDHALYEAVMDYTETSPERVYALARALEYIVEHDIPGDIVECGVWQGGSMMATALTLKRIGDTSRNIYLCDVFHTGWPTPTNDDVSALGERALESWENDQREGRSFPTPSVETTRNNVLSTGYPADKVHCVVGKVQDTLPGNLPAQIALARLDTDLYESTLHEINHIYPRVSSGGVIIVDDYGAWKGAQKAVDEYLAAHKPRVLLQRIDFTGRLLVKP